SVSVVDGVTTPRPNIGILFFALFNIFFSISAIVVLRKKLVSKTGIQRKRLTLVLTGIVIMLGLIIFTILLPVIVFNFSFFAIFAPLYALIFLGMTAIAITRYRLFNVKVIGTTVFVIVLCLVLFLDAFLSESMTLVIVRILFSFFVAILGFLVIRSVTREVEERKEVAKLARKLEHANKRLKELDRQKTDFLSIASHQLRTPLSIIKGYIELIEDGAYGKPTKQMRHIFGDIDESNERLVKMIDEFLDMSRLEQGRTQFDFENIDLCDTVDSVIHQIRDRTQAKGLKLVYKTKLKSYSLLGDEERIRHVVFNYVDNATKYTEKGTITVYLEKKNDGVQYRVVDTGIGFTKQDQDNFFQKYYRGKNVKGRNVNGTGLGLYVCRQFIEKHEGHVWAKSGGKDRGSEFGFWIPRKSKKVLSEIQKSKEKEKMKDKK
ncbi:MAG: ATP-binding protein, partial [Candidatus Magasanikbacteria bacterium]